jgi:hypothetical protein
MTMEQLAARLAGGFVTGIPPEALRDAIQASLSDTDLSELDGIKNLPGFVGAAADTLHKAWRAGVNLSSRAADQPRLAAVSALENAVVACLPDPMLRPCDLVARATERLPHASALFGSIEVVGHSELSPCWRDLLLGLAKSLPVRWDAGPRPVPEWLAGSAVEIVRCDAATPQVETVTCATGHHEAVEAMRWARDLIVSGTARPHEIAITAAAPAAYDDVFLALRSDANLDIHFVHSVPVVSTRPGQTAAALADILVRGPSQSRMRRLTSLLGGEPGPLGVLPEGWTRLMPDGAPLNSADAWERLLARLAPHHWPDGMDHTPRLRAIIAMLARGTAAAADTGEKLLRGPARSIWRRALGLGSPAAIDLTVAQLRLPDESEPCSSVAWMPAAALAASPRPFVRLLGLTSSQWPRRISEDRLVPDHVIPLAELDPVPVSAADRRDFETIMATASGQVVLSRARRDEEGRLLGASPLLRGMPSPAYLRRNRRPEHAMSETDRLVARPGDFSALAQAASANDCWADWRAPHVTPHDGQVRAGHPALAAALERVQSASSLKLLLRNPLGFSWRYALGLRAPAAAEEALVLDARASGELLHHLLDHAVRRLEGEAGLANADGPACAAALEAACGAVAAAWEAEQAVPPGIVWRRTLADTREVAQAALESRAEPLPGQRSFTEAPFGGQAAKSDGALPWPTDTVVHVADTGFRISGYVDRLDLSDCGGRARVVDYKGGKCPKEAVILDGGSELQRCLYAYAVRSLLGGHVEVEAALLYPRAGVTRPLEDAPGTLDALAGYLRAARASLLAGAALPGPDAGGDYDDLAFALPAMADKGWCRRKAEPVAAALGDAVLVWEAE